MAEQSEQSELETITLPHLENYPVYVALFKHVKNAAFLREQLLQGNSAFEYAFLDASMIVSRSHLLASCFKAVNDLANDRLKTRNVHSEIVFSLSPNNNIAESFRRFGLSAESTHIIAIKVATTPDVAKDKVYSHLLENVDGTASVLTDSDLLDMRDLARLRKVYKFEMKTDPKTRATSFDETQILSTVIGSIALRGV
ncbi:hypothetical protein CAC42_2783 [Sphaceloma murrayae]|uniref:EKC/KEOPS complex subunit CGI121 n=1 Tax=Sphaceloma murrayae TaxID=2082308 RepID=A0A2K1R0L7_9PEZI|nr:hypothetical protein CAC42_2783 [Sphaceloma murrayae]